MMKMLRMKIHMYPTNMHPDERDAYQSAVHALKASNWEREQHENIVGSKRKTGESSQSPGLSSMMRKSHSMRHSQQSPLLPLHFTSLLQQNKKISKIYSRVAQLKKRWDA